MRKTALISAIVMLGLSLSSLEGAGVDFSGNWVATKRGPASPYASPVPNVSLVIKQTGNDLAVIRNQADDEKIIEFHYTLDGAENVNVEPNEAGPITIRTTSRWDNGTLVLEGASTFEGQEKSVTNKWKREYLLSDNGRVLTISWTIHTPFGDVGASEVFSRK